MHFTTTVISLLATASVCLAASEADNSTLVQPPPLFYLQTQVVHGLPDCGTNKDKLWVYSFHTGAGLGDACLSTNKTWAMQAYLNDTQQYFTYPGNDIGGWPMYVGDVPYSLFNPTTISIAGDRYYNPGYYYNGSGLQLNGSVGGWLACDWWHGQAQLFNIASYSAAGAGTSFFPTSCSRVNLMPVSV